MCKAMRIFPSRCKIFEPYRDWAWAGSLPASLGWPASVGALSGPGLAQPPPRTGQEHHSCHSFLKQTTPISWRKDLSNFSFPDDTSFGSSLQHWENITIELQIEAVLQLESKVQRTRKANLFWTKNKEKWQLTWNVEVALFQKVDLRPSVSLWSYQPTQFRIRGRVYRRELCPIRGRTRMFWKMNKNLTFHPENESS